MINDFIGIFPNAISDEECHFIIDTYNKLEHESKSRQQVQSKVTRIQKDTHQLRSEDENFKKCVDIFTNSFWENVYPSYSEKYGILDNIQYHNFSNGVKIQKTSPAQGYHQWHCEHDMAQYGARLLLVIAYLNDVEDGGETEFLYQSKRVPAKRGTVMVCPSGFTHTHRGNPPLSGDKYIINGWVEFFE